MKAETLMRYPLIVVPLAAAAALINPTAAHAASTTAVVPTGCEQLTWTGTGRVRMTEVYGTLDGARSVTWSLPGRDDWDDTPVALDAITVAVAPGTYRWGWWDTLYDGRTYPHVGGTVTVAACPTPSTVVEPTIPSTTSTSTTSTTTTTVTPSTAPASSSTTSVPPLPRGVESTDPPVVETTTWAPVPHFDDPEPTTSAPATSTTDPTPVPTLPATGSNGTPLIAAGVLFLLAGGVAVASTHRKGVTQ
jgi:LPXTG-motif cell wall-anchored protein